MKGNSEITQIAPMNHNTRSSIGRVSYFVLVMLAGVWLVVAGRASGAALSTAPHIVTLTCPYRISNMALHTRGNKL